jgi:S1-C subfamily serine protease
MRLIKLLGVLVALAGAVVLAVVFAPSAFGPFDSHLRAQGRQSGDRPFMILDGRGSELGIRINDEKDGVKIAEVQPNGPAEKAGMKTGDVIVAFDGERVRSGRQLVRLVQETPAGKTVTARVRRDGSEKDLQVTPDEGRGLSNLNGRLGNLTDRLGDLSDRLQNRDFDRMRPFNFDFNFGDVMSGRRLGVTTEELTDQLAKYFGVPDGVLVTAVTDGSAASKAGIKAGDVITSIDGHRVTSRDDLVRDLRDAPADEVTIGIVREKKETTVKANVPAPSRNRTRGRV